MSDDRIRAAELADEIEALLRDDRVIELSIKDDALIVTALRAYAAQPVVPAGGVADLEWMILLASGVEHKPSWVGELARAIAEKYGLTKVPSIAPEGLVLPLDDDPQDKPGPFSRRTRLGYPPLGWTCFHCGETFTTPGAARDHFGCDQMDDPACLIKAGDERGLVMALRKAEAEIRRFCSEERDYQQYVESIRHLRDDLVAPEGLREASANALIHAAEDGEDAVGQANAVFAAIHARGCAILPREPSAEMIEAACLAMHGKCFEMTSKLQPAWADRARQWMRASIKSALAAGEVE